ncbi:OmpA family protein [Candidatus Pseudomonas adelgestsugas]|uniref:Outer membrane porin F n=1 Tax=Candidatus Pseudomonas adelgestsugas TaxID=1302376 RepID=A0ABX5R9T7_9PSED|nr:OmpA family protein [Candidatus Pseudomonas adelgestsugas]QAX82171.1 Outer membrane porin F precursor [Candidatus Pseudomonas adelgestsugas]
MKLKNTLSFAFGAVIVAAAFSALAQGQGAVEGQLFYEKQYNNSVTHIEDGFHPFAGIGYFLTDDVSLNLSYNNTNYSHSGNGIGNNKIKGDASSVTAQYHLGQANVNSLRPYIEGGFAHQSHTNITTHGHTGRNQTTLAIAGAGAKYYFTNNLFARAGVEADYAIDNGKLDYAALVGLGVNFGGNASAVDSISTPVHTSEPEAPVAQAIRVELDVKFDFSKSVVNYNSYGDVQRIANLMKQYPHITIVLKGHTDSVGSDAYNQKLSQHRADAIKQLLVEDGIAPGRVSSVGYGKLRPVADNSTEAGRAINRRVEATIEVQANQ